MSVIAACEAGGDEVSSLDDSVLDTPDAAIVHTPTTRAPDEPHTVDANDTFPDAGLTFVDAHFAADVVIQSGSEDAGDAEPSTQADAEPVDAESDAESDASTENEAAPSSGLPCDVQSILAVHCQGCHSATTKTGAPLMTRDDLLAFSLRDPNVRVADRVLIRMAAQEKPMPPVGKGDPVREADRHVIEQWVRDGLNNVRCIP